MKNHTPLNTSFTDGQLAILNELLDYLDNFEPTSFQLRRDFIAPKCNQITTQIKIEKELIINHKTI